MDKHKKTTSDIVWAKYLPILGKLWSDCTAEEEIGLISVDDVTLNCTHTFICISLPTLHREATLLTNKITDWLYTSQHRISPSFSHTHTRRPRGQIVGPVFCSYSVWSVSAQIHICTWTYAKPAKAPTQHSMQNTPKEITAPTLKAYI